jgi:transposase-like protein
MREIRAERWARLIAEQEAGGESVRAFCHRHSVGENSFYWWRRRLRESDGVRFAVVETRPAPVGAGLEAALELILCNGERLRIARGADAATLRLTLDAIRA